MLSGPLKRGPDESLAVELGMDFNLILAQFLNGIGVGMIYFLIAVGLSVIFGIMNFVNFAHGAFYMVGAYVVFTTIRVTGNFWVGLLVAPIFVFGLAWLLERVLLARLYVMDHMFHIVLTLGLALVLGEVSIILWGPAPQNISSPPGLGGITNVGPLPYPDYRLFVIAVTAILALTFGLVLERTRLGAIIRAGTESIDMVSALGIDIRRVFSLTFATGAALAAVGGALAAPIRGVDPFMGDQVLGLAFVVVVVGGMGSFVGALLAALLIGIVQSLTILLWPLGGNVVIYLLMALILLLREAGLMGRQTRGV